MKQRKTKKVRNSYSKIIMMLLLVITISMSSTISAYANSLTEIVSSEFQIVEGGYTITVLREIKNLRSTNKTAQKEVTYYGSGTVALCKMILTATFSVNVGSNVQCISTHTSGQSYDSLWFVENRSSYADNSNSSKVRATGEAVFRKRVLGIPVQTKEQYITIYCDKYGNLT